MKKRLLTLLGCLPAVLPFAQSPVICPSPSVPAADLCADACIFCNLSGFTSTTVGFTGQTPPGFCGTVENEQWIGFVAGDTVARIIATPSNCANGDGIQLALYPSCDSTPIACAAGTTGGGDIPVFIQPLLNPGQAYYLMVDGYAGDQCDFTISVLPNGATTAPPVGSMGAIQGPTAVCVNDSHTFSVTPVSGAGLYLWTAPPDARINGQTPPVTVQAPGGSSVQIQFGPTAGDVCAQALNPCSQPSNSSCLPVTLLNGGPDTTDLPAVELCFEEKPYLLAWGDSANATGLYQHIYSAVTGCDSVVRQQVTFRPKIAVSLPPQSLCNGAPVTVCGQSFSTTGFYSVVCQAASGCDSTISFRVTGPGADKCSEACMICLNNLSGSTAGFTGQLLPAFCGTIENDQWMSFVAGAPSATFQAVPSNCLNDNGIQMALFDACNSAPIACNGGVGGGGNFTVSLTVPLTPGKVYYLMIDGYAADQCDFTLDITPGNAIQVPPPDTVGPILSPDTICTFQVTTVSVSPVPNAGTYTWTVSDSVLINSNLPPAVLVAGAGNTVQITPIASASSVEVCVEVANGCSTTTTKRCKTIPTRPGNPPLTLPVANVCFENKSYTLPWGDTVKVSGAYQHKYLAQSGCDSIVMQQVIFKPAITTNLPVKEICPGDSVVVCGNAYSAGGSYTAVCPSAAGCDSTVKFSVQVVPIVAEVIPPTAGITCIQPKVTLSSAPSPGTKTWVNKLGQSFGNGNTFTTGIPGYYFLQVIAPAGNTVCTAEKPVLVKLLTELPPIAAKGGTITKQSPWVVLQASSTFPKVSYAWSGPNGYQSSQQNPAVSVPGVYTVTVTDLISGCTNSTSVNVIYE